MMNQETGLATGSAFVQFRKKAAAQRCLVAAGDQTESGVQFGQRRLKIALALPRSEIERVSGAEGKEGREKRDRRNLYLAKEGGELVGCCFCGGCLVEVACGN
jgi:RNA recognition motif-containing protein